MAERAMIAMSGGVDSSVAAHLMLRQGYECVGATMKLFANGDSIVCEKTCGAPDDAADAAAVAARLGIPHHLFDLSDRFRSDVMQQFADAYQMGHTPNPCVECNRCLKFGGMLEKMQELGLHYLVTGHYAQVVWSEEFGCHVLKKAVDASKDQTYFLYTLTSEQLRHVRFPLGALEKSEVRRIAEENGFVTARKKEVRTSALSPTEIMQALSSVFREEDLQRAISPTQREISSERTVASFTTPSGSARALASPQDIRFMCAILIRSRTVWCLAKMPIFSRIR